MEITFNWIIFIADWLKVWSVSHSLPRQRRRFHPRPRPLYHRIVMVMSQKIIVFEQTNSYFYSNLIKIHLVLPPPLPISSNTLAGSSPRQYVSFSISEFFPFSHYSFGFMAIIMLDECCLCIIFKQLRTALGRVCWYVALIT